MMKAIFRPLLLAIGTLLLTGATDANSQQPLADPAFVGHYYLSGVMETGSELMLRADGSFEWYISYGSVDQTAHGTWHRDGGAVVLNAATARTAMPLFAFREIEPWSAAAEDELMRRAYDEADAQVRARCPFLGESIDIASAPSLPLITGEAPPSPETLRAEAAAALDRAIAARTRAETLARAELANPLPPGAPAPDHGTASEALGIWENARWEAIAAARKASLPEPALTPPVLPAACTLTTRERASDIPPARWTGGLGVRIYDPASEQGLRQVKATLHFADGTQQRLVTARRGLALLPGKPASPVVRIDLAADYAPGRDQTLPIPASTTGIIHVTADAAQLAQPPFTVLRLRIDGRALMFDAAGRGRYERPR